MIVQIDPGSIINSTSKPLLFLMSLVAKRYILDLVLLSLVVFGDFNSLKERSLQWHLRSHRHLEQKFT